MQKYSSFIRLDREFIQSVETACEALRSPKPLPVVINGLTGGASDAYVAEAIGDICKSSDSPILILTPSDAERRRVLGVLLSFGVDAIEFKPRELIFHNISASCDVDRERLSALLSILSKKSRVVVTTPSAALGYTMPMSRLLKSSVSLSVGNEISLADLAEKLTSLGFARVDMVEAAGQFSVRGGIVDVWHSVDDPPTRVEFFGDEVDRMVSFDPATQRSIEPCERLSLIPAREVIMDADATARVRAEIERLIKKEPGDEALERLIA